ncbi:MAG: efflux RND transporter periplasmic adaptor subunit [Lutibacter sp.]|uniref:efflux RND transporter periplasmic adaptor subunit n=1 Tax=Lutibacter sp. TaxID=1925666 RepID=UPI00181A925C|nr:efflux RND transporter periplasmic adaptor subunit [Lutibacter sp.]MBT8316734.1 efflux RND transporter periplasmic adaptor subunit [Lutibacter sp.]NNJ57594.1 efflux RND transporter periplasmic adaptor subunit [Lutibacter sp.]
MKNILLLFIATIFLISCSEVEKTSLDELTTQKTSILNKIDSLNQELKTIESQISKLDTLKKYHIVTLLPVKNENFKHYIEIQGVAQADKNIEVRPELGGTVKAIYVKEGQQVSAGQTLIQLDDASIQNSISELNTQLELAKTTFDRQERLWNQKIGSEMQYLQAKAQKEGLENSLTSLKTQAKKMKITAPFNGIVDEIFPKIGELTSPQTATVRLLNLDNVYIEADITETYLSVIKIGTQTILNFPSINKEIESEISQIGNFINPDNRSFKTRINISNKDHSIKPNLLADLKIVDFAANGIVIPSTLVQKDQNGNTYVFTLKTENGETTVAKNLISIEKEYNNEVFISKGLQENDSLINKGARIVKEGDIVKVSDKFNL